MLRKALYTILFLTVFVGSSRSQAPAIQWQYCYDTLWNDIPLCVQQTNDAGYILCGYTGNSINDENCWILRIDQDGTKLWQKIIAGAGKDRAVKIQQTIDGGFIVGGYTDSNDGSFSTNHGGKDYWVAKLTSSGEVLWQKMLGGSLDDILTSVQQTIDGGYIISGKSNSTDGDVVAGNIRDNAWIVKLSATGNIEWQKTYGGSNNDNVNVIKQTPDGGYIMAGESNSIDGDVIGGSPTGNAWIVKLSGTGNIEWQKGYGNNASVTGMEGAVDICLTSDGNYGVAANCNQNGGDVTGHHSNRDYWILKLDVSGNLLWQRALGGTNFDNASCISPTMDGGMVAAGWVYSLNGDVTGLHAFQADIWVVRLSATGSLLWQRALGGTSAEFGTSVSQTTDLGYIVAGYANSNNSGDVGNNPNAPAAYGGWVVKLGSGMVPVTLTRFDASATGQNVLCTWKTLQEQNSSHFIVERSNDAVQFYSTGHVPAAGNSTLAADYQFMDDNILPPGKEYLYYRLKMVDLDGSFTYSNTIKVTLKYAQGLRTYPNPVTDQLTVSFTSPVAKAGALNIINEAGVNVYRQSMIILKGNNSFQIDTRLLPAGNYILSLKAEKKYQGRFVKLNK